MEALEQINARLTAERDEARRQSPERARVVLMLDEDLDEAQKRRSGARLQGDESAGSAEA